MSLKDDQECFLRTYAKKYALTFNDEAINDIRTAMTSIATKTADAERLKAANEVRRILRQEIDDANPRIARGETNPLYWLNRRFEQLADEIEEDDYYPASTPNAKLERGAKDFANRFEGVMKELGDN